MYQRNTRQCAFQTRVGTCTACCTNDERVRLQPPSVQCIQSDPFCTLNSGRMSHSVSRIFAPTHTVLNVSSSRAGVGCVRSHDHMSSQTFTRRRYAAPPGAYERRSTTRMRSLAMTLHRTVGMHPSYSLADEEKPLYRIKGGCLVLPNADPGPNAGPHPCGYEDPHGCLSPQTSRSRAR